MVNCINSIIEMNPRFILGRENVPCVTEVINRSLKADCTDFTIDVSEYPTQKFESYDWLIMVSGSDCLQIPGRAGL